MEIYGYVAKIGPLEDAYDVYVRAGFTEPKMKSQLMW